MEVYNIYINGEIVHDKVSESTMFDLMQDYARDYYLEPDKDDVIDPKTIKIETQKL
tara:strand:+ start:278 stop:445 length:168 start_codon:yes stop_codon:yes gene_type:complete